MALFLFLLFIISYFLHLTERIPVLGTIRFDILLASVTLLSALFLNSVKDERFNLQISRRLIIFIGYVLLSLPLVTWPGSVLRFHLIEWIKVSMFFVLIVVVVHSVRDLKWVIIVFLACQLFRVFEPLYMHFTIGYWGDIAYSQGGVYKLDRLAGSPFDIVNSNQLAWVIVTIVPYLFYLFGYAGRFGIACLLFIFPLLVYALLLTGSRSGLLCLIFTIGAMIWLSQNRKKAMVIALVIGIPLSVIAVVHMGSNLKVRYLSLIDSEVVGADTVKGRIDGLFSAFNTISNNPLFGNGLGTSAEANHNLIGGRAILTHNLYLEVIQETGIIGIILFMMFIIAMLKSLKTAHDNLNTQNIKRNELLYRIILSMRVWIYMDLFYSLSCFGLRSWEWYYFGGVSALCLTFSQAKQTPIPLSSFVPNLPIVKSKTIT